MKWAEFETTLTSLLDRAREREARVRHESRRIGPEELDGWLRKRGVGRRVRERVIRLNPDLREGDILRGFRKPRSPYDRHVSRHLTKGDVIRRFGRAAWDTIPAAARRKHGRREYAPAIVILNLAVPHHDA